MKRWIILFITVLCFISCSKKSFFEQYYKHQNYEFKENVINLFDFETITECDSFIKDIRKYKSYSVIIPIEGKPVPFRILHYTIRSYRYDHIGGVHTPDLSFYLPNNENVILYRGEMIEPEEIEKLIFDLYKGNTIEEIYFGFEEKINPKQITNLYYSIVKGFEQAVEYKSQLVHYKKGAKLFQKKKHTLMRNDTVFEIGKKSSKLIRPPNHIVKPKIEYIVPDADTDESIK
jgi:hypothetical protein